MKRTVLVVVLASCGGNSGNPKTLWLAPDQAETKVMLIDHEPPPF